MFKNLQKRAVVVGSGLSALALSSASHAEGLTTITDSFKATEVAAGVMAVGVTLAVIYVAIKGARIVLGMIKG